MDNPEGWIAAVHAKLMYINVSTLKELVVEAPTLNANLRRYHQVCLNVKTISEMMFEVGEMVQWPNDPEPEPESDQED